MPSIGIGIGVGFSSGSVGWLPRNISDLKLWLRADRGITLVSGNVSQWDDQSGNGNNVAQATAGFRPPFAADGGPNNTPFVGPFDGVDDRLVGSFTLGQPCDVFVVGRLTVPAAGGSMVDGVGGSTRLIYDAGTTGSYRMFAGLTFPGAGSYSTAVFHRFRAGFNGASSKWAVDDEAVQTGDAGATASSGVTVGTRGDASNPSSARVAEVIAYSRILTVAEVDQVQSYLKGRYGI